jgi:hypothetical protein
MLTLPFVSTTAKFRAFACYEGWIKSSPPFWAMSGPHEMVELIFDARSVFASELVSFRRTRLGAGESLLLQLVRAARPEFFRVFHFPVFARSALSRSISRAKMRVH